MRKFVALAGLVLLSLAVPGLALGQDYATPSEVVAKVRAAAKYLAKTGDVAAFRSEKESWTWKDTYVFVNDCKKMVIAAAPYRPELIGQDFMKIKDTRGKLIYPKDWCAATRRPSGVWIEYWWPKPGEKQGSRKLTYALRARGTPYVVAAGVYDDKTTLATVRKLTRNP